MDQDRRAVLRGAAALIVAGCGGKGDDTGATDTDPTGGTDTTDTTGPTDTATTGTTDTPTSTLPSSCTVARDPADDAWLPLRLADVPELAEVGGSTYTDLGGEPLILARIADDCVVAMDRICTHAGCEIHYSYERFSCPCHGSTWNLEGELQAGPARDQKVFPAVVEGDTIWLRVG